MTRPTSLFLVLATFAFGAALAQELTLPETIEVQQSLIESEPGIAAHHNDLGNLFLLTARYEEAEAAYRQALTLDPELASARFNLGLLFQQTRREDKARREFEQVTKIQSDHAWAHYQLGVLFAERGRRKAAITSYARALKLDPRLTDPAYNPHILDNTLAPSATLAAYSDDSSADLVPRTYQSPRRIAGLMVPGLPKASGAPTSADDSLSTVETAPAEAAEPATPRPRAQPPVAVSDGAADGFEDEVEPAPEAASRRNEAKKRPNRRQKPKVQPN